MTTLPSLIHYIEDSLHRGFTTPRIHYTEHIFDTLIV